VYATLTKAFDGQQAPGEAAMTTAANDPNLLAQALSRPKPVDTETAPYLGVSAFFHAAFLLLAMIVPPGAATMELDGVSEQDRFVEIATSPMQDIPQPVEPTNSSTEGGPDASEQAAKHAGAEGKAGAKEAADTGNRMAIEGAPDDLPPEVAQRRDRRIASAAGVEAIFNNTQSAWAGTGERTVGTQAITALGNLDGREPGESSGFGGLGVRDSGRQGGGDDTSFGMAEVDTNGPGGGGDGDGSGPPRAAIAERDNKLPPVVPGPPVVDGPLDKEIIQRVVRRHRREISYCYESQLQQNPRLEGRIVVNFKIASNGRVVAAMTKSTTMNNRRVESCIANKIRHWNFPAPSTTGLVSVNYPFRFTPQN
jgi:hypothetical protein